ncbi:MAG: c-type cytochrome, partial [Candidatus Hydrogenedentes bacterium]|nr:c-type cytochrome [Candidatus Hydrogenedentota bacterium]
GEAQAPRLSEISTERGDPWFGELYYRGLCSNCHGQKGEGGIGNTLNSPTFLAIASDRFLATAMIDGRPGTAMASWKHLSAQALSDLIAYLRSWQGKPPSFEEVVASMAETPRKEREETGAELFLEKCAVCHGIEGEGAIGPRLNNDDFLNVISEQFLYRTIVEGRPSTAMPAWRGLSASQVAALITLIESWGNGVKTALAQEPNKGDQKLGELFYRSACAECHGDHAQGGSAPQLANQILLDTVSDAVMFHWIAEGRADTEMKGYLAGRGGRPDLTASQIADIVAYIRDAGAQENQVVSRTAQGDVSAGHELYEESCSLCHGEHGDDALGPQLNNPVFLRSASDGFLAATIALGRENTPMQPMMDPEEGMSEITPDNIQDVIAYMRQWESPGTRQKPRSVADMSERAIASGKENFAQFCAECHGPNGRGEQDAPENFAPALNNPQFLQAASDGFLLATIARGRSNTRMRPFGIGAGGTAELNHTEIGSIVSYIRSWQEKPSVPSDP